MFRTSLMALPVAGAFALFGPVPHPTAEAAQFSTLFSSDTAPLVQLVQGREGGGGRSGGGGGNWR